MKKTEKKTEKKKSNKKKGAPKDDGLKTASKQLQKEFNKKMKALVETIQQDTERTIKTLMQEAREKIKSGSASVMNDVLASVTAQYQNLANNPTDKENTPAEATAPAEITITKKPRAVRGTGTPRKTNTATTDPTTRRTGTRTKKAVPAPETDPAVEAGLS